MEERAVADVYRQYAAAIWRRCTRILRDDHLALDVTQEVFIRCWRRHGELRPGRELLAWLYRVATNLCLNELRAARTRPAPSDEADAARAREPDVGARQLTTEVLKGLDRRTQAVAIYVFVDGMTHAEAASVAGISERTVRVELGRFLQHGRERLGINLSQEKT